MELNPSDKSGKPKITLEMFGAEEDVDRMIVMVRRTQDIMKAPAMAKHEPQLLLHRSLAQEFGADTDQVRVRVRACACVCVRVRACACACACAVRNVCRCVCVGGGGGMGILLSEIVGL